MGMPRALWCTSQGRAGSLQEADISPLKFTFFFPSEASMTMFIPTGHSYFELRTQLLDSRGQGPKQPQVEEVGWIL